MIPVDEQLTTLERLLQLERSAEEQALREERANVPLASQEADGVLMRHLTVAEEGPAAGGLWSLTLQRSDGGPLPAFRGRPGDPVALGGPEVLAESQRTGSVQAVLHRIDATRLTLTLDPRAAENLPSQKLAVWPEGTPVTFERAMAGIRRMRVTTGRTAHLRDVILGVRDPEPSHALKSPPALTHLNDAQREAVLGALSAPDVFLIHGPPGTGKTTTAATLALEALQAGQRVLLCAPSNTGADELTRALLARGGKVLRVGHPARVDESLHDALLLNAIRGHERYRVAQDLIRQAENLRTRSGQSRKSAADARAERRERATEWRAMIADARKLISQAEEEVMRKARAVSATLTVCGGPDLVDEEFDLAILDEASQAVTPLCFLALGLCQRLVLVGDHKQLPPTVVSPEAERGGLGRTIFDARHEDGRIPGRMLTVQHRMHQSLMTFPSAHTYAGRLTAHPHVAGRGLENVLGRTLEELLSGPLTFVDTAGTGFSDEQPPGSTSWRNEGEARLCALLVRKLIDAGLTPIQVAVIAPYSAQVDTLRDLLATEVRAGLEVDSVDAFQGREKEAVVVGLTRSNEQGEIGFVADGRRLNVAITRARAKLFVVGDSATVGARGHGAALVEHAQRNNAYLSAYALEDFSAISA
ncbi:MAG: IGHMBP2 family helicase [Myxococcota bacterium]